MVRSMYGVQRFEAAADTDIVARWRDRVSEGPVSPDQRRPENGRLLCRNPPTTEKVLHLREPGHR